LLGFIAFRAEWIDQFYVLPAAQGRGIGSALLDIAKIAHPRLQFWTFQRNLSARGFYESRGFTLAEETDGWGNEEREPDARYVWARSRPRVQR
jgi:putative acetyltransferase